MDPVSICVDRVAGDRVPRDFHVVERAAPIVVHNEHSPIAVADSAVADCQLVLRTRIVDGEPADSRSRRTRRAGLEDGNVHVIPGDIVGVDGVQREPGLMGNDDGSLSQPVHAASECDFAVHYALATKRDRLRRAARFIAFGGSGGRGLKRGRIIRASQPVPVALRAEAANVELCCWGFGGWLRQGHEGQCPKKNSSHQENPMAHGSYSLFPYCLFPYSTICRLVSSVASELPPTQIL